MNKSIIVGLVFIAVATLVYFMLMNRDNAELYTQEKPATTEMAPVYTDEQVSTDEAADATLDAEIDDLDSALTELDSNDFAKDELSNTELGL